MNSFSHLNLFNVRGLVTTGTDRLRWFEYGGAAGGGSTLSVRVNGTQRQRCLKEAIPKVTNFKIIFAIQ